MSARIITPGSYGGLVELQLVRDALNMRADHPTDAALRLRVAEASRRIEGLTRMALPAATWEHSFSVLPDFLEIPGLFPVGTHVRPTATDSAGRIWPVSGQVQGRGESARVTPTRGDWTQATVPLRVHLVRGVNADTLPEDLRAAIITQVEQIVEGFNMAGENAILRTCSRYGWTGTSCSDSQNFISGMLTR